jgi:hypothetical protein
MKKLLFVLAFTFIGGQAFSQMYIVTLANDININQCEIGFPDYEITLSKVTPAGVQTHDCIPYRIADGALTALNSELNSIISQGYKLIETSYAQNGGYGGGLQRSGVLYDGTTFIFAIPWSASGLEEVPVNSTTLKSFLISPNPANDFVDVSLDYSLKGESEVVFITEGGYMSYKKNIGEILKNEKYNIDISKIPAVKYLVTIVNGKTYTTPKKLIVI